LHWSYWIKGSGVRLVRDEDLAAGF
jgi:hypothetical protein